VHPPIAIACHAARFAPGMVAGIYIRGVPNAYSWLIKAAQKNSGPTIVDPLLIL
jgi:hypothetical protein